MSRPVLTIACSHARRGRVRARPVASDLASVVAERDRLVARLMIAEARAAALQAEVDRLRGAQ